MLNIQSKYDEYLQKQRKIYPCRSNRASQLGHPCLRYLYYMRTAWEQQELPSITLMRIFEEGKNQEIFLRQLLQKLGYELIREQEVFEWKKYQITGTIDGIVVHNGSTYCVEFKSMSDNNFKSINSIQDIIQSKKYYMRGYLTQIMCYLILAEKEKGILLLKNKSTGELKEIEIPIDYGYVEEIIAKAEKINKAVEKNEPPEKKEDIYCADCPFKMICLPDICNQEKNIGTLDEIDDIIDEMKIIKEKLRPEEDKLKMLEKKKKEILENSGKDLVVTKKYYIEKKEIVVKPSNGYSYIKWDVKLLGE